MQTLEQQSQQHNNDYTPLEALYRSWTGGELVLDPYQSAFHQGPELTLSASIVIPAWNARDTLEQCLIAIEQSSFNCKYQQQLEVVLVDDGSTDGTWELLRQLRLNVRLKAVRQAHHSRAHTQNTGIAVAEGDVIICCDADMILTPYSIEEMVRRHQALQHALLIGFRGDVQRDDPRIQSGALREHLPGFLPPFEHDVRLNYGLGWPESMCRDTNHLKRLGGEKCLVTCDGIRWTLANMVYGALFSIARKDFVAMDGYDERFYGWGCEDTLVGVRALALENFVIPVYAAAGLHIAHSDRSQRKWHEFSANRRVFQAILRAPFVPGHQQWLPKASRRVSEHFEREPDERVEMCSCAYDVFTDALADPGQRGKYLYTLGKFDEAAAAFAEVQGTPEQEAWALFEQGKALRALGNALSATPLLEEAAGRLPESLWPPLELALAFAEQGEFGLARTRLEQARDLEPDKPWINFIYRGRHLQRAQVHLQQGDYGLALRDYEAALILNPDAIGIRTEYTNALALNGKRGCADRALLNYTEKLTKHDRQINKAFCKLAEIHLVHHEIGPAKRLLEQAHRHNPYDQEVQKLMASIHLIAAQQHPLPYARAIAKRIQSIPGWLWEDEAELLIALTLKIAACRESIPTALIEIGSYCGRATVAMGLAARSLDRDDIRIISIDEPSIGTVPGGGPAREVLRSQLAEFGLADMVIYSPEDEADPWKRSSQLVFVDGRHDYAGVSEDVARYTPSIAAGGYLVFHDYADYYPDVQRFVDELLMEPHFEFVAQTGSLLALMYRGTRSSGNA